MVGRVWPRHGHRGRPLNSVVSHQLAKMGRASSIFQVVISLGPIAAALAFTLLVPAASSAPGSWGAFGIALAVLGFGAFAYARLSVLRARGFWAWGTAGMLPTSRKLYWTGYILMGVSVLVVLAAAMASTLTGGHN